jgi:parallel beta-helix repeat protein
MTTIQCMNFFTSALPGCWDLARAAPGGDARAGAKGFRARSLFRKWATCAGALLAVSALAAPAGAQEAATVRPGAEGMRIERSARIELDGRARPAAEGEVWLEILGDGITVELAGELRGAAEGVAPDAFEGVGIRVTGKQVTLRGARVSGYKVGIHADGADGLVLEDCDVSGNFRQRLRSTKEAEASEDWLDPHHNDARQWFTQYGAGIYVDRASGVTVRRCRARAGQNGLVLDRCERAQVHDNDFSFLSGWGIALWRTSDSVIARNATDFCIRGYSHGVYNRGQDSAGILFFEQCSRNVVAENSATHCGDGFFGFAGQEALGGVAAPEGFEHLGKGNNQNLIINNDFSYAAAHGLELTFSFDNRIVSNRMRGNAICGVWAGYSRDTLIVGNTFEENGDAGYGLERGGVNIEHGQRNRIVNNGFRRNACGVHLWWDADEHLAGLPWTKANGHESRDNCVQGNVFEGDELALHLRDTPGTRVHANELRVHGDARMVCTDGSAPIEDGPCFDGDSLEPFELPGTPREPGWLSRLPSGGRERIQLDEWGPIEPTTPR